MTAGRGIIKGLNRRNLPYERMLYIRKLLPLLLLLLLLPIAALADAYGLTPPTCRKRLKAGTPLDAPVTHGFARPCEYKGARYDSIEALAWAVKLTHDHARELVDREGKWL